MAIDEQLDKLAHQLSKQSLGPIDVLVNEAVSRLGSAAASVADGLRWAATDRPLITLLLSFQVGYLVARLGRRYARR